MHFVIQLINAQSVSAIQPSLIYWVWKLPWNLQSSLRLQNSHSLTDGSTSFPCYNPDAVIQPKTEGITSSEGEANIFIHLGNPGPISEMVQKVPTGCVMNINPVGSQLGSPIIF